MSDDLISVLGGREVIGRAVEDLYRRIGADPLLAPVFAGYDVFRIQRHMHEFLLVALGGPAIFSGRSLDVAHAGLGITDAMFDRTVDHVRAALRACGVADPHVGAVVDLLAPTRTAVVAPAGGPASTTDLVADRVAAERAFSQTLHMSSVVTCWRAFATAHGGEIVVSPRFIASRVPGQPSLDQAFVLHTDAVEPVLELYRGVPQVAVWTRPEDEASATEVAAAGFARDRRTTTMAVRLHDVAADPNPVPIDARADPSTVARLTDTPADLVRDVAGVAAYTTQDRASGLLIFRSGTDAVVSFLATEASNRRRGLATSLLRQSLLDVRRRGVRTASLQANPAAEGLCLGLGFQRIGGWQRWVRTV